MGPEPNTKWGSDPEAAPPRVAHTSRCLRCVRCAVVEWRHASPAALSGDGSPSLIADTARSAASAPPAHSLRTGFMLNTHAIQTVPWLQLFATHLTSVKFLRARKLLTYD